MNIVCFGFGQVAKNFIKKIDSTNLKINLTVTSRDKSGKKKLGNLDYQSLHFSEYSFDQKLIENLKSSDHILVSIAPVKGEDIVIKNFKKILEKSTTKWITYLSATSVYGNHSGEWVDEKSNTKPTSTNGIDRLYAEKLWLNLADKKNLPVQIFRLSGIYSNQNNVLTRLKSGSAKLIEKKKQFFSRIHVEDIANVLFKSLQNFKSKEIYNISDDKPTTSEELISYGSKLLNIKKPKVVNLSTIESEMVKNFYKDSKKVNNKKMKEFFNYKLKHPTYVEGLNYIHNNTI